MMNGTALPVPGQYDVTMKPRLARGRVHHLEARDARPWWWRVRSSRCSRCWCTSWWRRARRRGSDTAWPASSRAAASGGRSAPDRPAPSCRSWCRGRSRCAPRSAKPTFTVQVTMPIVPGAAEIIALASFTWTVNVAVPVAPPPAPAAPECAGAAASRRTARRCRRVLLRWRARAASKRRPRRPTGAGHAGDGGCRHSRRHPQAEAPPAPAIDVPPGPEPAWPAAPAPPAGPGARGRRSPMPAVPPAVAGRGRARGARQPGLPRQPALLRSYTRGLLGDIHM